MSLEQKAEKEAKELYSEYFIELQDRKLSKKCAIMCAENVQFAVSSDERKQTLLNLH